MSIYFVNLSKQVTEDNLEEVFVNRAKVSQVQFVTDMEMIGRLSLAPLS